MEMSEAVIESAPSSSKGEEAPVASEPKAKKRKMSNGEDSEKLEHRLGGILCCAVCLDLPPAAVYQCSNGHLMCAACFTHLLADARLRDDASATCPNCRIEISKNTATRNLAVEKAVSELPSECQFCTRVFPRHSLQHHEELLCDDRELGCRYACIGCEWRGAARAAAAHEAQCALPHRRAADVLPALAHRDKQHQQNMQLYNQLIDLLSCENITFNDLELKPYRTEEFGHKLYYESLRFSAFGHQWVVKAFVNKNQRDPTQSASREITYQLVLRSAAAGGAVSVQWVALRGAYGAAALGAALAAHAFTSDAPAAPPRPLPLRSPQDANRLLADRAIHFRLIMFQMK